MKTTSTRKPKSKAPARKNVAPKRKWRAWFFADAETQERLGDSHDFLDSDCIILRRLPMDRTLCVHKLLAAAMAKTEYCDPEGGVASVEVEYACAVPGGLAIGVSGRVK